MSSLNNAWRDVENLDEASLDIGLREVRAEIARLQEEADPEPDWMSEPPPEVA